MACHLVGSIRIGRSSDSAQVGGTPCAPLVRTWPPAAGPWRVCPLPSVFFCEHLLQHHLVQRQVSHQALELGVLLAQLPEFTQLVGGAGATTCSWSGCGSRSSTSTSTSTPTRPRPRPAPNWPSISTSTTAAGRTPVLTGGHLMTCTSTSRRYDWRLNPQGNHLRNPKNCPTARGHF